MDTDISNQTISNIMVCLKITCFMVNRVNSMDLIINFKDNIYKAVSY